MTNIEKFVNEFNSKNGNVEKVNINMRSFMAKNCESPSIEEMKKNNNKAFEERQNENNKLIEAYTNNKLKSPRLIKKAKGLVNEAVSAYEDVF